MFVLVNCLLVVFCLFFRLEGGPVVYPDFDVSMLRQKGVEGNYALQKKRYADMDQELVAAFKRNYEKNISDQLDDQNYRIPRIIHQIWLGGEVPEKYHKWMAVWASLKGWEYRLWMDEDVKSLNLYNKDVYELSKNKGEKSDILRLELLSQYGGVYVDVDYECVNVDVFEELHKQYDFYIGFEPLQHGVISTRNMFKMCNALIASIPHHPLVKHLIVNMKANYLAYHPFTGALERSGPSYLTRVICEYILQNPDRYRNMYLPCTFFYPFTEKDLMSGKSFECLPETAGIHYWSGSWRTWDWKNKEDPVKGCSQMKRIDSSYLQFNDLKEQENG